MKRLKSILRCAGKRLKFILQHIDAIWSVPLAFLVYLFSGIFLTVIGAAGGVYDITLFQPLIVAAGIVIGAANLAIGGMYFTFRGLYRYIYGNKTEKGERINYSKIDWKKLTSWQRLTIGLSVFFFFFWGVIVVYLILG